MNIDPIIDKIRQSVKNHELGVPGCYSRYTALSGQPALNPYGCADALNIRYTIDDMPKGEEQRACTEILRSFQNEKTGLFTEATHPAYHCTAHCIAALELCEKDSKYPVYDMERLLNTEALKAWLANLKWYTAEGTAHYGAGLFSGLYITRKATKAWQDVFFGWLDEHADPDTGISAKGAVAAGQAPEWLLMGDWFHFLFCYHAARRKFPYAERMVDSCIGLYRENRMPESFGKGQRFLDIDWVFSLNRCVLQTGYRFRESRELLSEFAERYVSYLQASPMEEPQWEDMHLMFGAACALAELQIALPGQLQSTRALRQVLDRRPFI